MTIFENFARSAHALIVLSDECEEVIIANTPEDLKSELTSKIRQIIAIN